MTQPSTSRPTLPACASFFVTRFREVEGQNGARFIALSDDAPAWLKASVRDAHRGSLPNDWIYKECKAAAEIEIAKGEDESEAIYAHAESRVEVYTHALFAWATDFCTSETFTEAQAEVIESGVEKDATIELRLRAIQFSAILYIATVIRDAIRVNGEG